jgi:lysophosphatidate acyltransferase
VGHIGGANSLEACHVDHSPMWFLVTLSQAVFLDRSNRNSAVASAKKAAEDIHRKQTSVWIFPEGTRGHPHEIDMLPFKKGAFHMAVQAGVPIVPIVIANYNHLYDSKAKRFIPGVVPIRGKNFCKPMLECRKRVELTFLS